jgi:ammonium transporter, Amt family
MDYFFIGKWLLCLLHQAPWLVLLVLFHTPNVLTQAITPARSYIAVYPTVPVGVVAGLLCNLAIKLKFVFNVDDGLDVFALHGIGGYARNVMTGLFAADYVTTLDGVSVIPGGWVQGNWIQLGYQFAGATRY